MSGKGRGFPVKEAQELLVKCHRRCCICHRFCGVKIELDHITPKGANGSDEIDNAIPVCFECHAEIHSYNDKHPRGRKFKPEELVRHKMQWLDICENRPEIFIHAARDADVGPLQALIDELEFNKVVSSSAGDKQGCRFLDDQFRRAIREGMIAILDESLKRNILTAYQAAGKGNHYLDAYLHARARGSGADAYNQAMEAVARAGTALGEAHYTLLQFLGRE